MRWITAALLLVACSPGAINSGGDGGDDATPDAGLDAAGDAPLVDADEVDADVPLEAGFCPELGGGECEPGTMTTEQCGNCLLGTRTAACGDNCRYGAWTDCMGEGECAPGGSAPGPCGDCGEGTAWHTCEADCSWGAWGACEGQGCSPGSSSTEPCGNCGAGSRVVSCSDSCTFTAPGPCPVGGSLGACLTCTVDIGSSADEDSVGSGWHYRESETSGTARWIDGSREGHFSLGVAPSATTLRITWSALAYREDCGTGDGRRVGHVRVDGAVVGSISIPHGDTMTASYPLPAAAVADSFIEVVIASDHAFQPSACTGTADTRWLAIRVYDASACY